MPYISMQTNVVMTEEQAKAVLAKLSAAAAEIIGKEESKVQAMVQDGLRMMIAGQEQPTAFVQVKDINFAEDRSVKISGAVCGILKDAVGIEGRLVNITFESFPPTHWGKDSKTFA